MENLEDLKKRYEELGKEIEKLEKAQSNGRVSTGEKYYLLLTDGDVECCHECFDCIDNGRYKLGNYFKTEEEAIEAREKQIIYMELKRLAERLNNGRKIDWNDDDREKFFITYQHDDDEFDTESSYYYQRQGVIYCLDEDFLDIALKEIGEDRLIKLFR